MKEKKLMNACGVSDWWLISEGIIARLAINEPWQPVKNWGINDMDG